MTALEAWREIVRARQAQMDAAYADLERTSTDFWNRRAERFRAQGLHLHDSDLGLRLLRRLTNAESTVLDVGAGAGRYARAIAPHVRRVVAVEPNNALAEHIRTDAAAEGLTNLAVIEASWEEASADPADLVLCSHVLYPHAEIDTFVRKLDAHALGACLILAMAAWQEPAFLLEQWRAFHHEPRRGQPNARDVFNVLYEMCIMPNVEVDVLPGGAGMWSFASLDEAVAVCREHLILSDTPETGRRLSAALTEALQRSEDGRLSLPALPRLVAGLWWRADSPRLGTD